MIDMRGGGDDVESGFGGDGDGGAIDGGDGTARFGDEEDTGGAVPWFEFKFPVAIETAGGDVGEVEGGGAGAAEPLGTEEEGGGLGDVIAGAGVTVVGVASGEEAVAEGGGGADVELAAGAGVVEMSAAVVGGGVTFICHRIVDDGDEGLGVVVEGHGDGEVGEAVGEVGGTVEGVDVPSEGGVGVVVGAFFADEAVGGECLLELGGDLFFGGGIVLGNEVDGGRFGIGGGMAGLGVGLLAAAEDSAGGVGNG